MVWLLLLFDDVDDGVVLDSLGLDKLVFFAFEVVTSKDGFECFFFIFYMCFDVRLSSWL